VRQLRLPGLEFTLRDFMQRPTIAGILNLESSESEKNSALVALNDCTPGAAAPLFCLHAGTGTIFDYQPLAKSLHGVRPVYGVACRTLADPRYQDESLAQMAADYARMIRQVQPQGPYHLMGWSLGGALAALVAAELEAGDGEVGFIGLVDPFVPDAEGMPVDDWRQDLVAFVAMLFPDATVADLVGRMPEERPDVPVLAAFLDGLLTAHAATSPENPYMRMGCEELAWTFIVAQRLKVLASAARTLLPLRARAQVWWRSDRRDTDRTALAAQLAGPGTNDRTLPADHFGIIRDRRLIAELGAALPGRAQASTLGASSQAA